MAETVKLENNLALSRCPHCGIAKPHLQRQWVTSTQEPGKPSRTWSTYACSVCQGVALAYASNDKGLMIKHWPSTATVDESIPERPRQFLRQAIDSRHAPAGAVMLVASAVDAMLKAKGNSDGSLNKRIDEACSSGLITKEMAAWAHDIRLDANDQRHADESAAVPDASDADKVIEFALALAQFLFVLPSRVQRGRAMKGGTTTSS